MPKQKIVKLFEHPFTQIMKDLNFYKAKCKRLQTKLDRLPTYDEIYEMVCKSLLAKDLAQVIYKRINN